MPYDIGLQGCQRGVRVWHDIAGTSGNKALWELYKYELDYFVISGESSSSEDQKEESDDGEESSSKAQNSSMGRYLGAGGGAYV